MRLNLFQAHIARQGVFFSAEAPVFFKARYWHQQHQKIPESKVKMCIRSNRISTEFQFGVTLVSLTRAPPPPASWRQSAPELPARPRPSPLLLPLALPAPPAAILAGRRQLLSRGKMSGSRAGSEVKVGSRQRLQMKVRADLLLSGVLLPQCLLRDCPEQAREGTKTWPSPPPHCGTSSRSLGHLSA